VYNSTCISLIDRHINQELSLLVNPFNCIDFIILCNSKLDKQRSVRHEIVYLTLEGILLQ
jgi:hypothetical protein